ncbi:meiotic recombination protein DMC1 homolog isoform X1 [Beta vulgaris subsp. vulgaris]|uniref:meiotic recombination protein DMC1 homolog isoform X1 n=1 Tax=Beta vulgaris subsp. vulgaris TaxID=3555 RepID=UPI002036809A|nr:meiotic recombination protein DMC1 homolog isoform X1 [Beta vulgaris subsp. vulgaris]
MAELQIVEGSNSEKQDFFALINEWISHGMNAGNVRKLEDAGIISYTELMTQPKEYLAEITQLPEDKVGRIQKAAENIVHFGYIRGSKALLRALECPDVITERVALLRTNSVILITSENQAQVLNGGIETFTGMLGEVSSGDTQIASTQRVSTECDGELMVSFLPEFPNFGNNKFLVASLIEVGLSLKIMCGKS